MDEYDLKDMYKTLTQHEKMIAALREAINQLCEESPNVQQIKKDLDQEMKHIILGY